MEELAYLNLLREIFNYLSFCYKSQGIPDVYFCKDFRITEVTL